MGSLLVTKHGNDSPKSQHLEMIYPLVNQHNCGKSHFFMGKSTISMGHGFHGELLNNQRVHLKPLTWTCNDLDL